MSANPDNFTPSDYYDLSFEIEKSVKTNSAINLCGKNSAWLRAAISRAYYAAFLTLRAAFQNNPNLKMYLIYETQDHQTIIDKLYTLKGTMKVYANNMKVLRGNRNHCDYHLSPNFDNTPGIPTWDVTPGVAETSIKNAKKIIENAQYITSNIT